MPKPVRLLSWSNTTVCPSNAPVPMIKALACDAILVQAHTCAMVHEAALRMGTWISLSAPWRITATWQSASVTHVSLLMKSPVSMSHNAA